MKHELWYSVVVRDRKGKVVSRERRRARSFLEQWNQLLYAYMSTKGFNIRDTNGTERWIRWAEYHKEQFGMTASAGTTSHGIRVGTGNTPVAIDDYALETPINEGTGVDEMNYLICTVATSVVIAPSCYFVVSRSIANNSLAGITVKEAAIYMRMKDPYRGCATRDIFGTPQLVPVGGTIAVHWTIKVTV